MSGYLNDSGLVLIIDDEKEIRNSVTELLNLEGFRTVAVSNAQEALGFLKQETKPSVILLDLSMPGMSANDFMANMRKDPSTSKIPVVVLSADKATREKAKAIGADEFFMKPVEIDLFFETMDRYCRPAANSGPVYNDPASLH